MAKTSRIVRSNQPENKNLVVHEIRIQSVDRTMKDIGKFIHALRSAESVHYPNRVALYDIYSHITLDAFLVGIMNKRIDAVLNKEIRFYNDDKEVEGMEEFLESEVFRDICHTILNTKFYGVSGMEFVPGEEVYFEEIPRKHIKPETKELLLDQSSHDGINYSKRSNVWVIGKKRDFGLLLQCSVYALYKKGDFADWAQYIEIFGQPMRIAKYDANDIKTKTQLTQALTEAGSSLALLIPKQAEFEVMDGKTSNGTGELQQRFKDACNNEMSVLILGNTETTSSSNGGSNAKAQEHGKQQMEVTKSDMAYLLTKLNSKEFLNILASYNLPVEGGKFKFEKDIDLVALGQKVIIDMQVAGKVPVGDDYFYDTYHIPKPVDYAERRKKMDEAAMPPVAEDEPPADPKKPATKPAPKPADKKKEEARANLSAWQKLRASLADFFDPAH